MFLLVIVGIVLYFQNKIKDKNSSINTLKALRSDLTTRFKYAAWVIKNQDQVDKKANDPSYPQITREQSDCLFESMVARFGLNNSISALFISRSIQSVLLDPNRQEDLLPLKETMDLLNSLSKLIEGSPCEDGQACGVPSSVFNKNSSSPVCTY